MLYRTIVRSKLDYGCIVCGTASNTNLRQLDSIHNAGLRLALGSFCTSPVSVCTRRPTKLYWRNVGWSCPWITIWKLVPALTTQYIMHYMNLTTAEIEIETVCTLKTPTFPPGTHEYDPKRHSLIEGVSKCMIIREEAQAKFREYRDAQGPHDEVYTDGSKIDKRVGAAAVIKRHFQNGETTCRQLSKRLPNNSTILAAEAKAITLAVNYYRHMDPVQHDVVIYSDSMSCRQLKAKILTTLSFARSWISSGHWATKALVSASAGCQAIVA